MPARPLVLAALLTLAALPVGAADVTRVADLPPLNLSATVDLPAAAPGGVSVSRPLTPCADPGDATAVTADPYLGPAATAARHAGRPDCPFGSTWTSFEYLAWWPKGQPLPPLVTAGRGAPVLGSPATVVLVGGSSQDSPTAAGGRFTTGFALDDAGSAAAAVTYFFLGSRTDAVTVVGRAGRPRQVGRPFVDALTGDPGVLPVGGNGFDGAVTVATTVRVTGWEVNGFWSVYDGPVARVHALAGYRYFQANEGLRIEQVAWNASGLAAAAADQFDARNRFHGGQLGVLADLSRGSLLLELAGKVAFGQGTAVVNVSGASAVRNGIGAVETYPAGVLAVASNSGRASQTAFAVLPEAQIRVGYRSADRSRIYLGYNFLYLSDAVRPGDQIDGTLDLAQVPLNQRPPAAADRPAPLFVRSDFWVQGIVLGLEYRY